MQVGPPLARQPPTLRDSQDGCRRDRPYAQSAIQPPVRPQHVLDVQTQPRRVREQPNLDGVARCWTWCTSQRFTISPCVFAPA